MAVVLSEAAGGARAGVLPLGWGAGAGVGGVGAGVCLHNRRYIGSKAKLVEWIFSVLRRECGERDFSGGTFVDFFAGTGVVAAAAARYFGTVGVNDVLYSNGLIYEAFFGDGAWGAEGVNARLAAYNAVAAEGLEENYFSRHFGGKFFSEADAKRIGFVREAIERERGQLTRREYCALVTSLLYAADKVANTVGHYDAYFKRARLRDGLVLRPIVPIAVRRAVIFREDANRLAESVDADVAYVDPPYNSRQYSRFYHVLETLAKWDKPPLFGVALKPAPENMSDYCRVGARAKLQELVARLRARVVVVSYNNTYAAKSGSSQNKIALEDIAAILRGRGEVKRYAMDYRFFNAGRTEFVGHKEYLFVCHVRT